MISVFLILNFLAVLKEKYEFITKTLNLGGGYGIWYTDEDKKIPPKVWEDKKEPRPKRVVVHFELNFINLFCRSRLAL